MDLKTAKISMNDTYSDISIRCIFTNYNLIVKGISYLNDKLLSIIVFLDVMNSVQVEGQNILR